MVKSHKEVTKSILIINRDSWSYNNSSNYYQFNLHRIILEK